MDPQLAELVESVVRQRFPDHEIDLVDVRADVDEDGDHVLIVTVTFDPAAGEPDREKVTSLPRYVRHALAVKERPPFPVISFMSKADAEGRKIEAA